MWDYDYDVSMSTRVPEDIRFVEARGGRWRTQREAFEGALDWIRRGIEADTAEIKRLEARRIAMQRLSGQLQSEQRAREEGQ